MAADTSLKAFQEAKKAGKLARQQRLVYRVIKRQWPVSRQDIADHHLPSVRLSSVCGRVNDLIKKEYVEVVGEKQDKNQELLAPKQANAEHKQCSQCSGVRRLYPGVTTWKCQDCSTVNQE